MSYTPPTSQPAHEGSLYAEIMDTIRSFVRDELDDCLPCRVESYDGVGSVSVQLLPLLLLSDGSSMKRKVIDDVPVAWQGGSSVVMRFDIPAGSFGLLKACDRDLTLILQSMAEAKPNTLRRHSFSDSFFIPISSAPIASPVSGEFSLQTRDGNTSIVFDGSDVKVTTGSTELMVSESQISATVGSGKATLNGSSFKVTIGGVNLEFTGSSLKMNGIEIGPTHKHGGVTSGAAQTTGVVP